jgi:TRAP-type uncharacterized transport system fused permease subunit
MLPVIWLVHRSIAAKSRIAKKDLVEAFETGAKYALAVGAAAATVGIVIGVVTLTGVGFRLVPFVFVFAPSMLLVTAGFTWQEFALAFGGCVLGITFLVRGALQLLSRPDAAVGALGLRRRGIPDGGARAFQHAHRDRNGGAGIAAAPRIDERRGHGCGGLASHVTRARTRSARNR